MIIEKEFKKFTGKNYYAFVKLDVNLSGNFSFKSSVAWPNYLDGARCEKCICDGIINALSDFGYIEPFGTYLLMSIGISEKIDESVPIAFGWAAKAAITEYLKIR